MIWSSVVQAADVTLQWNAVTEATGYKIYCGTLSRDDGGTYDFDTGDPVIGASPFDVGNETIYTLEDMPPGTYYFAATAYNDFGESGFSIEVFTTIIITPDGIIAVFQSVNSTLTWNAVDGAVSYNVYVGTESGVYGDPVNVTEPTAVLTLNQGTHYIAISAINDTGYETPKSTEIVVPVCGPPQGFGLQ